MDTTATTADPEQAFTRFVKGVEPRLSAYLRHSGVPQRCIPLSGTPDSLS
jgi:hypothetical protein